MLQATDCVAPVGYGHDVPPLAAGVVIVYVCVLVPPPHVLVQLDVSAQLPTQFIGTHAWVLHDTVCVAPAGYGHGVPPLEAGVLMEYVCVIVPPPHATEHSDESFHFPTQFTAGAGAGAGHAGALQALVVFVGQAVPPLAAGVVTV